MSVRRFILSAATPERGARTSIGIDRMALMRHQVADIRDMYANDLRFVELF